MTSISRKIPYIAINRLALSQACKCCRCKVTAPDPPPPPPIRLPTPPSTPAGKTAEGSRGIMPDVPSHDSKRALDQRASGGKVWERPGKKTHPWLLSSDVLILCFSKLHRLIGNLLTFPSCNLIITLPFHKHPLAHSSYFSIPFKTKWLSGRWPADESVSVFAASSVDGKLTFEDA